MNANEAAVTLSGMGYPRKISGVRDLAR